MWLQKSVVVTHLNEQKMWQYSKTQNVMQLKNSKLLQSSHSSCVKVVIFFNGYETQKLELKQN